ncbi:required for excision 1-B domain-containing protein-like isoform X2 [Acropora muricata]|uniref:required for excision 1-B domain-containing protein-like isoform X2 n=1 Tax=Acropora muricata TaxID=159855 RepID=UPI0034E564AC
MANGPTNNKELIQRFFKLQEERVKVYQVFDSGFKEYLQTAPAYDFPKYRQLVYNVTQTFNNLSAEVIDIESKLRESGQHSISNLVRKIQLKEKEKLEMTAKLQIAEQHATVYANWWMILLNFWMSLSLKLKTFFFCQTLESFKFSVLS